MVASSRTDRADYRAVCAEAAQNPASFAGFRSDPRYRKAVEHVTPEQGLAYLSVLCDQSPQLLGYVDRFRRNDTVGGAITHDFGDVFGTLSPNTCRYAKVLSDLGLMFGSLDGMHIVEIGGGYGGQCAIVWSVFRPASYTIIDLPDANNLQREYLREVGVVGGVTLMSMDDVDRPLCCDLFVSNYALTECTRSVTDRYLEHVVRFSNRGYITGNLVDRSCYTKGEFMQKIPTSIALPEVPRTHERNYLLVWKNTIADARL